jgi:polysaccharide biosynthesis protein PslH
MIKVLSIAPYRYLPVTTGGQKNIALFYKYFSTHVNLTAVTVKNNDTDKGTYTILPLLSTSVFRYINLFYFFTLKRVIKQQEITHVMLEHPYYGWLGYLLKRFLKVKLIIRSHNIEGLRFKSLNKWWWRILWRYEKSVHVAADLSFFITEEDKDYAVTNFKLSSHKCALLTYGTEQSSAYTQENKKAAKRALCNLYNIAEAKPLLLYSAALGYGPNLQGLDCILNEISPLIQQQNISCNIIICGGGLPAEYDNLTAYKEKHIIYAGFVEDISLYYKAADIFLNPISEGGGIKTKLVEALAANATAISFKTGAIGVPSSITGNKLLVAEDNNAGAFVECLQSGLATIHESVPRAFFDHFYWGEITGEAAIVIKSI